jgi:hypothetical protein
MDDNKVYEINLPNEKEIKDFEIFLEKYKSFDPSKL